MDKKPKLSHEQDMAANPLENVWVQANAGTGKTSVLTGRLLRILFRCDIKNPSEILCLTYTNAGAGEMRNRILRALREWAVASDDELIDLLEDVALNKPATLDDVAHARSVFFWYIDNSDALKIKTIHSFCEEILRRFPIEAGISPAWTLVSDMNQRVLLQDTFDKLINSPDLDDRYVHVDDAFAHIVNRISEYSMSNLMKILAGQYRHFFPVENIDEYREYFINTVTNFLELNNVPKNDVSAFELQRIVDLVGAEIESKKNPADYLTNIFNLTKQYIDKTIDFEKYKTAYLTSGGTPIKHISKYDFLVGEQNRVEKINRYNLNKIVFADTLALFDLSAAFTMLYRDIKQQHNLLDFDDLVLYVRKLFSKPDVMGWVLSQLDLSLSHILVDEAQDTPPQQWDILQMLVGDFFVGGDTTDLPHSLFVVGDTKQSIYGFQGADSRAYASSHDDIVRQIKNNLRTIAEIPLTQSFRSLSSILYVVDSFFGDAYISEVTKFHNNPHKCLRTDDGRGLVEMHKLVAKRENDDVSVATYINDIVTKIKDELSRGKYKPKDIMVLVQRREPLVAPLVASLKRVGVPVAGSDRIVLPDFPAIRDLMNLVRFCLDTHDDYSLCCVLKSPIFRLTEADIFELCNSRNVVNKSRPDDLKITVFDVLLDARPDVYERLKNMVENSKIMAPYSFFSWILDSGIRAEFISALGNQVIDPLEEFMTICLAYERTQPGMLRHFLKWFITGGSEIKRDMNVADGVRIATVHGSKGLEAPVIFMIDTVKTPESERILPIIPEIMPAKTPINPTMPTPWVWMGPNVASSQNTDVAAESLMNYRMEEYYRLLYVAMTRARNELYIYGYTPNKKANERSWHALLWNTLANIDGAVVDDEKIRIIHE
ncbi:MAG: UvrD-helicase domain-containing protein [Alphaproteobacteria bacterium]|nr:UvrD-helicase domain-containing protein [Alphaproteobacteria bacterium]